MRSSRVGASNRRQAASAPSVVRGNGTWIGAASPHRDDQYTKVANEISPNPRRKPASPQRKPLHPSSPYRSLRLRTRLLLMKVSYNRHWSLRWLALLELERMFIRASA